MCGLVDIKSCKIIIDKFGKDAQVDKCIEEMAELTKALLKDRIKNNNRDNVIEELGDVLVMVKQVQLMYEVSDELLIDVIDSKIRRTLSRVGRG